MSDVFGGWSFTAYSNREQFQVNAVRGFSDRFSRNRMDNNGTYPGNAKNTMLEPFGDHGFIEAGNVAFIQSHGNVYGPDVEFNPSRLAYGAYRWGERGRLQWVVCGGCDILGLVTYPDGTLAPHKHPHPSRWSAAFIGISGVLGFRSSSFYQPSNGRLGYASGLQLANYLVQGHTFWRAWILASDYLHRVLNVHAETCIYVNSEKSLSDTLITYNLDRTDGLDINSIKLQMVGRGGAAKFTYCHKVDVNGVYDCNVFAGNNNVRNLTPSLSLVDEQAFPLLSLPCFGVELVTVSAIGNKSYKVHPDSLPELAIEEYAVETAANPDLVDQIREWILATENRAVHFREEETLGIPGRVFSAKQVVQTGQEELDVFGDYGMVVEQEIGGSLVVRAALAFNDAGVLSYRSIGVSDEAVYQVFKPILVIGALVTVNVIRRVYVLDHIEGKPALVPALACYATIVHGGSVHNVVEVLQ